MVQETSSLNSLELKNQVECSLNALVELRKGAQKRRVLIDNGESIFLQIVVFKVPELDEIVRRRISLKYPIWAGVPDVCLIVRDFIMKDRVKRTSDEMIDITVEKYQDLLEKHKVIGITNVMPYHQLKTEYDTYELRKKLINRFDIFLCDSYLHSREHFFDCLGKIFIEKNKFPIAVKLPKLKADYDPMVSKRITSAIASTVFYIKPSSDNYSIRIGNTLNEKEEIIENLNIVIDKILQSDDLIPGGIANIRSLYVKTEKSKAVPIYMSLSTGSDIPVPFVKTNAPVLESVEDEISTLPGKKVTVLPSGDVFVTSIKKKKLKNKSDANDASEDGKENEEEYGDEDDDDDDDEYEEEDEDEGYEEKFDEKDQEIGQEKEQEGKEVKEIKEVKELKEPKVPKAGKGAKRAKAGQGAQGAKDAKVARGAKAGRVAQGAKGVKAVKGAQGVKGAKRAQDVKVAKVAKGTKKAQAAKGAQAGKGIKVAKKAQAAKGEKVAKGVKAALGAKRALGAKGVQGEKGAKGAKVAKIAKIAKVAKVAKPTKVAKVAKPTKVAKVVKPAKVAKVAKPTKVAKVVKPAKVAKAAKAAKGAKGAQVVKVAKGKKEEQKSKKRVSETSKGKTMSVQVKKESPKKRKMPKKNNDEYGVEGAIKSPKRQCLKNLNKMEGSDGKSETIKEKGMKRKLKDELKPLKKVKKAKVIKTKVKRKSLIKNKNITKTKKVK